MRKAGPRRRCGASLQREMELGGSGELSISLEARAQEIGPAGPRQRLSLGNQACRPALLCFPGGLPLGLMASDRLSRETALPSRTGSSGLAAADGERLV